MIIRRETRGLKANCLQEGDVFVVCDAGGGTVVSIHAKANALLTIHLTGSTGYH